MNAPRRWFATAAIGAVAMLAIAAGPAIGAAPAAIDQAPILRVLRPDDVRGSENLLLPSGALTLPQLVGADAGPGPLRDAERAALSGGYRAAAISAFGGPGSRLLRSFAVEFATPARAAKALGKEAGVLATVGVPHGSSAAREAVASLPGGSAVVYRGAGQARAGEVVLLARQGSWLFVLRGSGDHGGASRSFLARLLGGVIDRH